MTLVTVTFYVGFCIHLVCWWGFLGVMVDYFVLGEVFVEHYWLCMTSSWLSSFCFSWLTVIEHFFESLKYSYDICETSLRQSIVFLHKLLNYSQTSNKTSYCNVFHSEYDESFGEKHHHDHIFCDSQHLKCLWAYFIECNQVLSLWLWLIKSNWTMLNYFQSQYPTIQEKRHRHDMRYYISATYWRHLPLD